MTPDNKNFQILLQKFFLKWLITQRNVSPETVKSYRDAFKLFIQYLEAVHKIKPYKITIHYLEAEYIMEFLDFLEKNRGNQTKTINSRLAALHSFLRFLSFEIPEYSGLLSRSLMIPFRAEEKRQMDFLSKEEFQALSDVCDLTSELGQRDRLMILILYNTGVRVSELIGIRVKDIISDSKGIPSYVHIHGKGRKDRDIPLWKSTAVFLNHYIDSHEKGNNVRLFVNRNSGDLTRSGVRYRLNCLLVKSSELTPSVKRKTITPHTFRHTVALNLLQSGIDISTIAIWLGHESILTTHKYMEADLEMKRRTLEKMQEPDGKPFIFQPNNTMLSFLNSL